MTNSILVKLSRIDNDVLRFIFLAPNSKLLDPDFKGKQPMAGYFIKSWQNGRPENKNSNAIGLNMIPNLLIVT